MVLMEVLMSAASLGIAQVFSSGVLQPLLGAFSGGSPMILGALMVAAGYALYAFVGKSGVVGFAAKGAMAAGFVIAVSPIVVPFLQPVANTLSGVFARA
ncbi:hypothetical protein HY572_00965 [Candidatus Micrarchaeota archaeon]|nr:hypothetical protein [Candidatus Micrarchaeota archaeon]